MGKVERPFVGLRASTLCLVTASEFFRVSFVVCKCFLLACGVSVSFFMAFFEKQGFHLDVFQLIFFFFINHAFGVTAKGF